MKTEQSNALADAQSTLDSVRWILEGRGDEAVLLECIKSVQQDLDIVAGTR